MPEKEKEKKQKEQATPGKQKKKKKKKNIASSPTSPSPTPSRIPTPIPDGYLEIGTIVSPQGLDGELRVYPETDFPERFLIPGMRWLLHPGTSQPQEIELTSGRYIEGRNLYVIELQGVKSRNQAEELRSCKLLVLECDRPQLADGEYHIIDLIGLQVFVQESGQFIGTVVNLIPAGNDLLEVEIHQENNGNDKKPKNLLIPFVKEIVPVVDIQAKRAEITPPEGLLEINDLKETEQT
ncbi:ribosome maturation factor RimM [Brunnivagina elsteri]|uniref:Ribosome maturation factor RimM n=1 Tax=Brunnivagina elsteri CCALA 953 TaxID=987040 RepID=A0A2A2TI95_9CYAN|nr:ribosome maturation factor RimM [Calothrix elsteri]PAX53406.1 ribosome maturation factor RimM [Calothrix elsteri CCALA 953]